eukprot:TRINITY_DN6416_c0_g1_i7.p3 TRINITY_DN6416_c0_g1~~TRINITY_DN6416_c0_g1_i7.p3  ORF type:complete len:278 (+),score=28.26 TRINITY_DN6416_c0_g1_i7:459-1292(+)
MPPIFESNSVVDSIVDASLRIAISIFSGLLDVIEQQREIGSLISDAIDRLIPSIEVRIPIFPTWQLVEKYLEFVIGTQLSTVQNEDQELSITLQDVTVEVPEDGICANSIRAEIVFEAKQAEVCNEYIVAFCTQPTYEVVYYACLKISVEDGRIRSSIVDADADIRGGNTWGQLFSLVNDIVTLNGFLTDGQVQALSDQNLEEVIGTYLQRVIEPIINLFVSFFLQILGVDEDMIDGDYVSRLFELMDNLIKDVFSFNTLEQFELHQNYVSLYFSIF